jgi:hypothetical protein
MSFKPSKLRGRQEGGQATVEFALSLIILMAFTLFYLQLTLIFGIGNYVHYATFMAARAYLSAGPSRGDQVDRANAVIIQTLKKSAGQAGADRFSPYVKATGGGGDGPPGVDINDATYNANDPVYSFFQGIRYTYKSTIFPQLIGNMPASSASTGPGGPNVLTLKSESWLGREASYSECRTEMQTQHGNAYFDNGC